MAIRTVITHGFGNGTFDGAISSVVTRGYAAGEAALPIVEVVKDKGKDAGSGRKQWWEGEWIVPGVTHYLPEKPPEDIIPLRPELEKLKERLARTPSPEIKGLLTPLSRLVAGLERRARNVERRAREDIDVERAIQEIIERYRDVSRSVRQAEARLAAHEARMVRINRDDEEILAILVRTLD